MIELTQPKGDSQQDLVKEANEIISSATKCVDRGEGKGKCHVFLDQSNICQCTDVHLIKSTVGVRKPE